MDIKISIRSLHAYVQNGILYISGARAGATIRVYNTLGVLIASPNPSEGGEFLSPFGGVGGGFSLPGRGIYIITDGTQTVKIKDDLEILKVIILEKVPTDQIWLFGSYAYGTPNKDSDIDIYIVMKDDARMRELDAMDEVNGERFYRRTKKPVDVLAIKRSRFDYRATGATMERKIKREIPKN